MSYVHNLPRAKTAKARMARKLLIKKLEEIVNSGMNKTKTDIDDIYDPEDNHIDLHCWIEHNGEIKDYPTKQLKAISPYGTDNIVYVPFPIELQLKLLPIIQGHYKEQKNIIGRCSIEDGIPVKHMKAHMETALEDISTEIGQCSTRAQSYKEKHPKAKLRIGSMGFKQTNGNIYYEYG